MESLRSETRKHAQEMLTRHYSQRIQKRPAVEDPQFPAIPAMPPAMRRLQWLQSQTAMRAAITCNALPVRPQCATQNLHHLQCAPASPAILQCAIQKVRTRSASPAMRGLPCPCNASCNAFHYSLQYLQCVLQCTLQCPASPAMRGLQCDLQ